MATRPGARSSTRTGAPSPLPRELPDPPPCRAARPNRTGGRVCIPDHRRFGHLGARMVQTDHIGGLTSDGRPGGLVQGVRSDAWRIANREPRTANRRVIVFPTLGASYSTQLRIDSEACILDTPATHPGSPCENRPAAQQADTALGPRRLTNVALCPAPQVPHMLKRGEKWSLNMYRPGGGGGGANQKSVCNTQPRGSGSLAWCSAPCRRLASA